MEIRNITEEDYQALNLRVGRGRRSPARQAIESMAFGDHLIVGDCPHTPSGGCTIEQLVSYIGRKYGKTWHTAHIDGGIVVSRDAPQ